MPNMGMMQMGVGGFAPDGEPDTYTFTDQTGKEPSAVCTSNTITVVDINITVEITITGGTYSKNGGGYTASAGTVTKEDTIAVRVTASSAFSTAASCTTTIGGIQDTFSATTRSGVVSVVGKGTGTVINGPGATAHAPALAFSGTHLSPGAVVGNVVIMSSGATWVGKDWGSPKIISQARVYSAYYTRAVNWSGNGASTVHIGFYGSNSSQGSWNGGTQLAYWGNTNNAIYPVTSYSLIQGGLAATAYRYHWFGFSSSSGGTWLGEIDLWQTA